jgi:hypothetical protein
VPWGLVALLLSVLALVAARDWVRDVLPLPSLPGNPFAAETVDRTGPAVLQSIQDLREYRAATGHFEVIVDIERDTALPARLLGERALFVAVGNVDAVVDFGRLGDGAVSVSPDRRSATITLPRPSLSDARLDLERSYVYDRQRGVLNRLGAGEGIPERELYLTAERRLAAAATNAGLVVRAQQNTRDLLESLLGSLGFERVVVRFS